MSMVLLLLTFFGAASIKAIAADGNHYRYGPDSDWFTWTCATLQPWFHFLRVEMAILAVIYPTHATPGSNYGGREPWTDDQSHPDRQYFSFDHLSNATVYQTIDFRWSVVKSVEYPTSTSLWAMFFLSWFYCLLAWYFGQVASSDEGSHESCCFCCFPSYWGLTRQQVLVMDDDDTVGLEKSRSQLDQSVRTYKLSKAYQEETAVQELTLTIESSCCLALLGTNGAGKSTLIKTLTGVHPPTYGEAFIFGLDIRQDIAKVTTQAIILGSFNLLDIF